MQASREPPTLLQQELDALFGSGRHQQLACFAIDDDDDDDDATGAAEFCWDADSSTTIDFPDPSSAGAAGDTSRRSLHRNDSVISVNSTTPAVFEHMSELAVQVGEAACGSVLPDVKGIAVEIVAEVIVRMALRTIQMFPRELAMKVVSKYRGRGGERLSTTFSCSDAVMEAKCAVVIASKMLLGEMDNRFQNCEYTIDQVVAAEIEQFKCDYLISKTRNSFHRLHAVTKDRCILQSFRSGNRES